MESFRAVDCLELNHQLTLLSSTGSELFATVGHCVVYLNKDLNITKRLGRVFQGIHKKPIVCSNDTRTHLITAGADQRLVCWDKVIEKSVQLHHLAIGPQCMVTVPDGTVSYLADGTGRVYQCHLETGDVTLFIQATHVIKSMAIYATGQMVITGDSHGVVTVYDYVQGVPRHSFTPRTAAVTTMALSDNGRYLVVGYGDGVVTLHDVTRILLTIAQPEAASGSPYITVGIDAPAHDLPTPPAASQIWSGEAYATGVGPVLSAAFSPDCSVVVTASSEATILVWKVGRCDRPARFQINLQRPASGIAFIGKNLFISSDTQIIKFEPAPAPAPSSRHYPQPHPRPARSPGAGLGGGDLDPSTWPRRLAQGTIDPQAVMGWMCSVAGVDTRRVGAAIGSKPGATVAALRLAVHLQKAQGLEPATFVRRIAESDGAEFLARTHLDPAPAASLINRRRKSQVHFVDLGKMNIAVTQPHPVADPAPRLPQHRAPRGEFRSPGMSIPQKRADTTPTGAPPASPMAATPGQRIGGQWGKEGRSPRRSPGRTRAGQPLLRSTLQPSPRYGAHPRQTSGAIPISPNRVTRDRSGLTLGDAPLTLPGITIGVGLTEMGRSFPPQRGVGYRPVPFRMGIGDPPMARVAQGLTFRPFVRDGRGLVNGEGFQLTVKKIELK